MGATLGLALITRDEERSLPRLLASVSGCFDQVVVLDTGSVDGTLAIFAAWAREQAASFPGFEWSSSSFEWCDDFAAARNAADALLTTEWRIWADADDEIEGAAALRSIASRAPADVSAFAAEYETAQTLTGGTLCHTQRIRLTRAGTAHWCWPVHEQLVVEGGIAEIPAEIARWVHRKNGSLATRDRTRNLRILQRWLEREPDNVRALEHAGREEAAHGEHLRAVEHFRRLLDLSPGTDEERARAHRQLALSLLALGRLDEAADGAAQAVAAMPEWPDGHLTLAEVALARGDGQAAVDHAREVLRLGPPPRTPILLVQTDYTAHPRMLIARALQLRGDADAARLAADEALAALAAQPA